MHYTGSHAPVNRGGINDSEAHIVLGSGEFVTTIEGGLYGNAIGQLLFKTNKGIVRPESQEWCTLFTRADPR